MYRLDAVFCPSPRVQLGVHVHEEHIVVVVSSRHCPNQGHAVVGGSISDLPVVQCPFVGFDVSAALPQ